MSDDDGELAAMRRAGPRGTLPGAAGDRLEELRRRAAAGRDEGAYFVGGGAAGPGRDEQAAKDDDDEDDDDEAPPAVAPSEQDLDHDLRLHFPLSFGVVPKQQAAVGDIQTVLDQTRREADAGDELVGPVRPSAAGDGSDSDAEACEDEREGGGGGAAQDPYNLPVTHEVVLTGHTRLVSALDVEHTGSRVVTGGYDFGVRLYDFAGMKRDLRPFRELEPCGAHQIRAVSWSPSGDAFMVVSGSAEPKIIDRDGRELGWFVRGDMYIRDARHTRGHIMGCTSGAWHPHDKQTVLTASEDGTLRLWDVTQVNKDGGAAGGKCQTAVIKPVGSKPGRLAVSACAWSPDGSMIAGGISDGSLQVWSAKSNFASAAVGQVLPPKAQMHLQQHWTYATRPAGTAKGAHAAGEDGVTALRFKRDNVTLASRSTDGTMKLWDIRKLAAPLRVVEGLPTSCPQAGLVFSPDESLIVTSLSDARDGASGALAFFETSTFKLVRRLGVPSGAAAALAWHPRLNQIFVGAGGRAGGGCRILYDPDFSERGALVAVARAPRAKDASDLLPKYEPAYERPTTGGGGRKRQRELVIEKARVAHKPQGPAGTAGAGGRIGGGSGGTLLTQYLLKERGMLFNASNEMDPRESVLRHSSASFLVDTAYAETQPKRIFSEPEPGEEEEEEEFGAKPATR